MEFCCSLAGFGFTARVTASSESLLSSALRGLPIGFRTLRRDVSGPHFQITMRAREIELRENDQVIYTGPSKRGLRTAMEAVLELRASTESDAFAFLHAGGVTIKGRAIIFPGRSHAGKSTLVEAFLKNGAAYLSDDMVPIDRKLRAHPFPRPLGRRSVAGGPPVKIPLGTLKAKVATRPVPIALIWCGVYDRAVREASFQSCVGREAFGEILAHAPGARIRPEVIIPILSGLATSVPVFRGSRGDANQMVNAVLDFLKAEPRVRRSS